MTTEDLKITALEQALEGLIKVIKAVHYYPSRHPSLNSAVQTACRHFAPLLTDQPQFACQVHKQGFSVEGKPVGSKSTLLPKLAGMLFSRRIQRLLVLPDLSERDLRVFSQCLTLDPLPIQQQGGISAVLEKAMVSTIWVNQTDLREILKRKQELDEQKRARAGKDEAAAEEQLWQQISQPQSPGQTDGVNNEEDLNQHLQQLHLEKDDTRYCRLLEELPPLVRLNLTDSARFLSIRALVLLCRGASHPKVSPARRASARQALKQLISEELYAYLIELLCSREGTEIERQSALDIVSFLKGEAARHIMERLVAEEETHARKQLSLALARQGKAAVAVLVEHLDDEHWYVVRNAVAILGEIRDQESAEELRPLLHHPESRVRREALRALTKIGGTTAIAILLQALEGNNPELACQSMVSLGALKAKEALPALLRRATRRDLLAKHVEDKKMAIRALGEIGARESLPNLVKILKRRRLLGRTRHNEIRAAAALAIGELGDPEALGVLERATAERSPPVSRAAAQALRQLRKNESDESRTL